jgi:hypothetical protein
MIFVFNFSFFFSDLRDCNGSIKLYIENAILIRDLRAAIKGGKWGTVELAEALLKCVKKNRNVYDMKKRLSETHSSQNFFSKANSGVSNFSESESSDGIEDETEVEKEDELFLIGNLF